jgi:serine phosphatase RsbU (regulator of sigma subunit)/anti-sigma regulatory factor (Ser/Thr protein kinase)
MDLNPPPPLALRVPPLGSSLASAIVIEGRGDVRARLYAMLETAGASVVEVADVDEAIALADRGEVGLVLCGVSDGGEALRTIAARRMASRPSGPWALVAVSPEEVGGPSLLDELQHLADDFLPMPISSGWLGARLRLYGRMGAYVSRMQAQREALKRHQDEAEEEQRIASHLISRLEGRDPLAERMMHAWVSPAHHLSGDVVAVARAPDDRINVLLADGTGHGLAAAISVLPVSEVFHRMTDRGFDIASIVTEMNRKLRSCMPADRFVACTAASIDMRERVIELWNGGCPPVTLLGADGSLERVWRSRHMALGILDGKDFDSSVERCAYREQSQLMVVSDGLSEALGADGKHRFGDRELLEAVRGPADQRLERVVHCLHDFTGGRPLEDDASILLVDCLLEPLSEPVVEPETPAHAPARGRGSHWALEMRLGPAQLRKITLAPFVSGLVEQLGIPRRLRSNVFCVLSELLANALDYGVLGMDPAILEQDNGRERFREDRAQRLAGLASGSLWFKAAVEPSGGGEFLQVEIEDSGGGFDIESLEARLSRLKVSEAVRRGRGLELVRSVCDTLRFDQDGRRVVAVIALSRPA